LRAAAVLKWKRMNPKKAVVALMRTLRRHKACPYCDSKSFHRSRRRGVFERNIISLFSLLPFWCEECGARFLMRVPVRTVTPSRPSQASSRA